MHWPGPGGGPTLWNKSAWKEEKESREQLSPAFLDVLPVCPARLVSDLEWKSLTTIAATSAMLPPVKYNWYELAGWKWKFLQVWSIISLQCTSDFFVLLQNWLIFTKWGKYEWIAIFIVVAILDLKCIKTLMEISEWNDEPLEWEGIILLPTAGSFPIIQSKYLTSDE